MIQHLTPEQVEALKGELTTRRQQVRESLRDELLRIDEESYSDLAGAVHDPGDESVADMLVDMNNSRVTSLISQLREVESALERIDEGSYGVCVDGEEEIPFERLRVQPTARRCIQHQARHEQTFAESGRPSL